MNLLVIRHAIAEEREEWAASGEPEEERPLTDTGRKKMKKGARGIRSLVQHIDLLATSPLTRAVQTAELVAREYDALAVVVASALEPQRSPATFLEWLRSTDQVETMAIVGHEPHLSGLVSWLLSARNGGRNGSLIELKKGGACLLDLHALEPGQAQLEWLLTAGQLRDLRD